MKSVIILSIIVAGTTAAYFLNKILQQWIQPRKAWIRLLLYFFSVLLLIFLFSFLVVWVVGRLYPGELIK